MHAMVPLVYLVYMDAGERRSWHHAQQNAWRSTDGHVVIASERDDLDVVAL
jgi:hypothetical protein